MKPVLSICIPTYNRAGCLYASLRSIVSQKCFLQTEDVEVVICDNCSSDDTQRIAGKFSKRFPEKIRYFRNETNIVDKNFEKVLSHGAGELLKLHNDTLILEKDALTSMVEVARNNRITKPVIFFANGNVKAGKDMLCNNFDEVITNISYLCTWIGGFSIWKSHFDDFDDFSRCAQKRLMQVDVLFRLIAGGKKVLAYNERLCSVQNILSKSGYNIAQIFGENYLSFLKHYLAKGLISRNIFEKEKRRLLKEHIIPYYFDYKKEHNFKKTGYVKYLKDYRSNWYFYVYFIWIAFRQLKVVREWIKNIFKRKKQKRMWRSRNPHNETTLDYKTNQSLVFVGNRSYGNISLHSFGHPKELLIIGNYVSIAADVKFILGGNHPYQCFSTYPFNVRLLKTEPEAQSKGAIVVEDDVWIGDHSIILSGVTLGQGAVIGAGSVVTKDVLPYSVVVGNPAKVVKYRFEKEVVEELKNFDFSILKDGDLIANKDILCEKLTKDNVKEILEVLHKDV